MTDLAGLWAGSFGDEYTDRNRAPNLAANRAFFERVLSGADLGYQPRILELGANVGANLVALRRLWREATLDAVEVNEGAFKQLEAVADHAWLMTIAGFGEIADDAMWDLVFTKGVLIHIPPEQRDAVYDLMYRASARYVLIAEYFNPTPQSIPYRGQQNALFRADFGGEFLDRCPAAHLVDYGFAWRRDPHHPQDDLTWWLFSK